MKEAPISKHESGRCVYLKKRNLAICPIGHTLCQRHYKHGKGKGIFYNIQACLNCPYKCTVARYKVFEVTMKKGKFSKEYDEADMDLKQIYMP